MTKFNHAQQLVKFRNMQGQAPVDVVLVSL